MAVVLESGWAPWVRKGNVIKNYDYGWDTGRVYNDGAGRGAFMDGIRANQPGRSCNPYWMPWVSRKVDIDRSARTNSRCSMAAVYLRANHPTARFPDPSVRLTEKEFNQYLSRPVLLLKCNQPTGSGGNLLPVFWVAGVHLVSGYERGAINQVGTIMELVRTTAPEGVPGMVVGDFQHQPEDRHRPPAATAEQLARPSAGRGLGHARGSRCHARPGRVRQARLRSPLRPEHPAWRRHRPGRLSVRSNLASTTLTTQPCATTYPSNRPLGVDCRSTSSSPVSGPVATSDHTDDAAGGSTPTRDPPHKRGLTTRPATTPMRRQHRPTNPNRLPGRPRPTSSTSRSPSLRRCPTRTRCCRPGPVIRLLGPVVDIIGATAEAPTSETHQKICTRLATYLPLNPTAAGRPSPRRSGAASGSNAAPSTPESATCATGSAPTPRH